MPQPITTGNGATSISDRDTNLEHKRIEVIRIHPKFYLGLLLGRRRIQTIENNVVMIERGLESYSIVTFSNDVFILNRSLYSYFDEKTWNIAFVDVVTAFIESVYFFIN